MRRVTVLLTVALLTPSAWAQTDSWSDPFPGVRHLHRSGNGQNIHAVQINLCEAGVSARVTAEAERGQTTSAFGSSVGAQLAINGDFFRNGVSTYGPAMHAGVPYGPADDNESGQVVFGNQTIAFQSGDWVVGAPGWAQEMLSGHWTQIHDGVDWDNSGDPNCGTNPRTVIGLSRDRHTLMLVVVDGRAPPSRQGLSCNQAGQLLRELGAWWGLNFDGGGSSTLWMQGAGVLNYPSDGTERVVGNHLAIYATGQGPAAHCDATFDEAWLQSPTWDGQATSDVDGDGRADACARDATGIVCAKGTPTGLGPAFRGPAMADATGWLWPWYGNSLRMGDLDGDGKADLCVRAIDGLHCWRSTGSGFSDEWLLPVLNDAAGWGTVDNVTTLDLADVTGDGKDDVCLRSDFELVCWPSTGSGFGPELHGPSLPSAAGWDGYGRFGTVRMGDVNGDGKVDVCARDVDFMRCWLSNGAGFPTAVQGPAWPSLFGFEEVRYWSTIRLADVNGDGKADLCARWTNEFRCHLSTGAGFGPELLGPPLSDATGWMLPQYFSTLRLGDIDGDGDLDLCARASGGMLCWKWTGAGFASTPLQGPPLSDATGWAGSTYYRSLRLADVNGDGKADLCGRALGGLSCWLSDGNGFPTEVSSAAFSNAAGFEHPFHSTTLRLASRRGHGAVPPPLDAGPASDAGQPMGDAGLPTGDAGLPASDAGSDATDGGPAAPVVPQPAPKPAHPGDLSGGCAQAPAGALAWLATLVAAARRRRARRAEND